MTESQPPRKITNVLAVALFLLGDLTETQLAKKLGQTLPETRQAVADFLNTAIEKAPVPVARIVNLETRLACTLGQVTRLQVDRNDYLNHITDLVAENHDLRNKLQAALFKTEELERDLAAERHNLADLARQINLAQGENL